MGATGVVRAATVGGLYALVLWGHFALPDLPRFALFLACVAGALVAGGAFVARPRRSAAPVAEGIVEASRPIAAERDVLHRLQAELHALEDQLRSAEGRTDALGREPVDGGADGGADGGPNAWAWSGGAPARG